MAGTALAWDLFVRDGASPGFLRVAGAADKAATATERAAKNVETASTRMAAAGAKLTKAVTLPLVGIAAVSVDMAAKFQQSTNVLVTAAGETTKNLKLVRKGILDIASSTGTSWKSVTDGMYQLEKAGYRGAAALMVEKAAAQAAREEGASLSTVTAAATSIMASYHLKASDAVMVMNQMKTAAGESKTTMEEFAGSLSTVLPLASANKVSFADIAGTLASLTQHGTSADESTQELAFALRGLSAPNAVAQKEMAQLGISSVDVAKRLGDGPGGRGLAGTLKYLAGVVASKTGPSGKLVLSTLNASKIAAHDATVEFNALAPATQKLAKQFINGTISSGEWTQSVKGLSPQQAALARQFAVTENNARGFQQLLRNGVSVTQTSSDALKKMAGGANGLNVILQTTGESMKGTDERIKKIADAAKLAGTNVSGWASTQKLFAVQLDIAKQKISVVAIQLGTALLPAVMKIVNGVQKAVGWFQNLSGTDKKILGWSLLVMAALGPIFSIGSKLQLVGGSIAKFASNAGTKIATLSGASEDTAAKVGVAMRRISGAVMGVTAGALASRIGGNSGKGWLASIFLGTAGGWALGGPVGAAVGGISAAIFKGVGLWSDHKKAAQAAAQAERGFIANLTDAINTDNGAIGTNLKLTLTKTLQDQGVLDKAAKLGVKVGDVVGAAMGDSTAKFALGAKMDSITSGSKTMLDRILSPLGLSNERGTRDSLLSGRETLAEPLFNTQGNKVGLSKSQMRDAQAAISASQGVDSLSAALTKANVDIGKAIMKADQFAHALNDTRVNTGKFGAELESLRAGTTVAMDANGQLTFALTGVTVVASHNRDMLLAVAKAAQTDAGQTLAAARTHESLGKATNAANGVLASHITDLMKTASAAGFNTKAVAGLVGTYLKLPKKVITALTKTGVKPSDIQAILDKYYKIPTTKSTKITADTANAAYNLAFIKAQIADLPSYKTITVTAATKGQLASTYASQVPGHAKGTSGLADGYFTVGEQGWELGHKSGGNVQLWDNKTSQKMTGMSKVPGYATGTSPSLSADWSSISTFLATARATASAASELSDAAKSLRSAAADNKVSSAEQARLARDSSVLGRLASARDRISAKLGTSNYTAPTAYDRLGTAQSAYSDSATTTRQAVMGSFDITTAGQNSWGVSTTAGILGAIQKAAANAGRFATLVKRLAKEGLNRHLLEQLTAAGPSALGAAEALAKATPKQLATINSAYKSITNTGYSLGTAVADDFYKAGVTSAEALVKGLLTKRSLLNKTISNLAGEMVISLENSLGLASGHMTKAQYTRAEKKLEATFNIQGVTDPEAFAQAVARRLATLVA